MKQPRQNSTSHMHEYDIYVPSEKIAFAVLFLFKNQFKQQMAVNYPLMRGVLPVYNSIFLKNYYNL